MDFIVKDILYVTGLEEDVNTFIKENESRIGLLLDEIPSDKNFKVPKNINAADWLNHTCCHCGVVVDEEHLTEWKENTKHMKDGMVAVVIFNSGWFAAVTHVNLLSKRYPDLVFVIFYNLDIENKGRFISIPKKPQEAF